VETFRVTNNVDGLEHALLRPQSLNHRHQNTESVTCFFAPSTAQST